MAPEFFVLAAPEPEKRRLLDASTEDHPTKSIVTSLCKLVDLSNLLSDFSESKVLISRNIDCDVCGSSA